MKINQLLIFLILPINVLAQISENFSDGNFTSNPEWIGDTSLFKVDSIFELQSHGIAASSTIGISTVNLHAENTEWQFFVRMDFSPSTTNYAKFYLTSDQPDCKGALNGYFVKLGGITGTADAIELYRQQGTSTNKIISGIPGHAGKNTNILRIKVVRYGTGNWEMYSDTLGGNLFSLEGTANDTLVKTSSWAGIVCFHTATRSDKFIFDDIVIKKSPLSISKATTINEFKIEVYYSQSVDSASASNPSNYFINNSIGHPSRAEVDSVNKCLVHLTCTTGLETGDYIISIIQVKDSSGIFIKDNSIASFNFFKSLPYASIIITEIFADPSPVVGLPEVEYVEIYNTTNDTINLKNYSFSDPATTAFFPSCQILPRSYLILCSNAYQSSYTTYGNVVGLSSWPALNNDGDHLTLKDPKGFPIYSLTYSDTWYQDPTKKDGGWSLELIDPSNFCGEENNWLASDDISGGTPGKANSVSASKPDLSAPQLIKIQVQDSINIKLTFDEAIDSLLCTERNFIIDPDIRITDVKILSTETRSIYLGMGNPLLQNTLYKLNFKDLADCNGNKSSDAFVDITIAATADSGDIIINEILFNPRPNGVDFVELYNRSDKFIDLQGWQLANYSDNEISNKKIMSNGPLIIKPHEYLFFTTDASIIKNQYPNSKSSQAVNVSSLPAYNDDEGTVILLNNNIVWDRFDYSETFHFALIKDKEGVSLERISALSYTNTADNWHSAASTEGYATPGYRNSQDYTSDSEEGFRIDPKIITPDEDGNKDFATINYQFKSPGNMLNIIIYDAAGIEVKRLVDNQLAAKEGFFQWDGINHSGQKVRIGYFIVYIEVFNLSGQVKNFKETIIVGSRQ